MTFAVIETAVRGLRLSGELDMAVVEDFVASAREALDDRADLVLDLTDLEFIDSLGINAIVKVAREVDGLVLLMHPRPIVRRVIDLTQIAGHLGIRVEDDAFDNHRSGPARGDRVDARIRSRYRPAVRRSA